MVSQIKIKFKYKLKIDTLAEQEVRIAELEKRHAIVSQNCSSKIEGLAHLTNIAMLRVEQMDQSLKTHIRATTSPKSSPKSISTQTLDSTEKEKEKEM